MENKNQIKEDGIAIIIDKPDFNENDKFPNKTIEVSGKIIVIKTISSTSITGSENTIIIPNIIDIYKLVVHGERNTIINYNENVIINVIGYGNNISYLANTKKIYLSLIVEGNSNNITNDGTPMISTIIGYQNIYRGVKGDKLIFVNRDYKTSGQDIKVREVVIDKNYIPHKYYSFKDFLK